MACDATEQTLLESNEMMAKLQACAFSYMILMALIVCVTKARINLSENVPQRITPRGKCDWNAHLKDMKWREAWPVPFRLYITNKMKEIHPKMLHNILCIQQTCRVCFFKIVRY